MKELEKKYRIQKKGIETVVEELKQRVSAKAAKVRRYEQRITTYRQNRLFAADQKRFYQELDGGVRTGNVIPEAEESKAFWNSIWGEEKAHNKEAEWLEELKQERRDINKQRNISITREMVNKQCSRVANWKAPGPDGVHGYWLKKINSLHERIAGFLNDIINDRSPLPEWMTTGKTFLCLKDPAKGNAVENFRPITCLPLMWKLMTGIISENLYSFLESEGSLPEEQKGCRKNSRGTKDQLLIDKAILKDCKRRHTNLAMAWIDYKKAYDMVPHSWIVECMDLFGVAGNIKCFIENSMSNWKTELTSSGRMLGEVKIRRGIFQGDSLSPLLFVLCMIPLTVILRKVGAGYEWKNKALQTNHLLFMDDLKLFGKNEDQINSLVNTVNLYSQDIGMEFGLKKCGVLLMKRGKIHHSDGIVLPDGQIMKEIEENGYKYLGILESDVMRESKMQEIFRNEYFRRLRLLLKSKLNGKNKIMAINTWAVPVLRYGAGIINWNVEDIRAMDRKTRKTMTMFGALHPKSDIHRIYLPRKMGGRGLISCEDCITSEENNLGWYIKSSNESLLERVRMSGIINTDDAVQKGEYKKAKREGKNKKWHDKVLHGQFIRDMEDGVDKEKTWEWLRKSDLKAETEALIFAAQEQSLRTNYVKFHIDKTTNTPMCRMCGKKGESISHIVSECSKLAQKEYKRRHDNIARIIHWKLCDKYGLKKAEKWYEHEPCKVMESRDIKILWDFNIHCDQ